LPQSGWTRKPNHAVERLRIAICCVLGLEVRNRSFLAAGFASFESEPMTMPEVLDHLHARQSHSTSWACQFQPPFPGINQGVERIAFLNLMLKLVEPIKSLVWG
jgi:hypothetical protein